MMSTKPRSIQQTIDNHFHPSDTFDVDYNPLTLRPDSGAETDTTKINLTGVLKKFKKGDIIEDVKDVTGFKFAAPFGRKKKSEMIDKIVQMCKMTNQEERNYDIYKRLHLKYIQRYGLSKEWSAMKVANAQNLLVRTSPEKFEKSLMRYMDVRYNFTVKSEKYHDALWTVLLIENSPKPDAISFLLTFPGVPLVLHTFLQVKYIKGVKLALLKIFQGTEFEELQIQEKCLTTVSHFGYVACRSESVMPLPLQFDPERKRRISDDMTYHVGVVDEDVSTTLDKKKYLRQSFGENVQPVLKKTTFNVNSNFYGFKKDVLPINANCQVVLKGNNILEGFHDFVNIGALKYPIPKHLLELQKTGQKLNYIKEKNMRQSE